MTRIAIVTGIPAPYREPVFAAIARRPGVEIRAFYLAKGHDNVAWSSAELPELQYDRTFVSNATPRRFQRLPFFGYSNLTLGRELARFAPDLAVVYGYNQLAHWLAFRYCLRTGTPFALRSDSNVHIDTNRSWQSGVRRSMVRWLVARAAGMLTVGTANADYWRSFGARDEQIFSAPYAVDNDRIAKLAGARIPDADGAVRFLYVGRLIPRKGVDLLVEAFNRFEESDRVRLEIVGDGPERERLQALQTPAAAARTRWCGKLTNDAAVARYGDADVFVLPAKYEPWGLVVNEAMAAGLPVVAENKCGAAIDLVRDGWNGRLLAALSVDSLHESMLRYARYPALAGVHGDNARTTILRWNFERTADGFVQAADAVRHSTAQAAIGLAWAGGGRG